MEILERVSQGHCPKCGSADINYGTSELSGESMYYEADCNTCEAQLHEWYDLKFSGFDLMLNEDDTHEVKYFDEGDEILNQRRKTTDETKKA